MLYLADCRYFLPQEYCNVMDIYQQLGITKAQANIYSKIYGLQRIPICTNLSILQLLEKTVKQLLNKLTASDKAHIKYLIYAHTAQILEPYGQFLLDHLKYKFGLLNTLAFGISMNKCVSTLAGFELAEILLQASDLHDSALILTGDIAFTPALRLVPNTSIVGDASAAALVSRIGNKNKLLTVVSRTYGRYSKGVWLDQKETTEFENGYLQWIVQIIQIAVKKAGISLEQLSLILPHNINIPSWEKVAKLLNIPLDKIYLKNVKYTAHCFGSDVLINYISADNDGLLKSGDYFLMATVGLGATFAAAVFEC